MAIVAIAVIGSGFAGYTLAADGQTSIQQASSFAVAPAISGHLLIEAHDSQGNLLAVRESDNIITKTGEHCALRLLFTPQASTGASTDGNVCVGALTNAWNYIAVGTGTTQEDGDQLTLITEESGGGDLNRAVGAATWTNATGSEPTKSAQVVLAHTFSLSGNGPFTISEAGLFNNTAESSASDSMFARQTFAGVTVNDGDSLTVSWTINVGNVTALD